jgi:hypothetical protein
MMQVGFSTSRVDRCGRSAADVWEGPGTLPTLADLLGWLTSTGWEEAARNARWATYTRVHGGSSQSIDVPLVTAAADHGKAVDHFVDDLAHCEGRSPCQVLADIRSACPDVVRWRSVGNGLELSDPRRASYCLADLPSPRDAARGLQRAAEELDVEVHGPVVALQSKAVDAGGTVTLQIEFDGRARLVKLEVGADDYATALEAHRTFLFVRAVGTLRVTTNGLQLSSNQKLRAVQARDDE